MEIINEWNALVSDMDKIYIYGAGIVARKISDLLAYSKKKECLKGYIVSSKKDNPNKIDGVSVFAIEDIADKRASILVSLSEVYHPKVFKKLQDIGFVSVFGVHKFYGVDIKNSTKSTLNHRECIKDILLSDELEHYRENLINKYFEYSHAFGGNIFYQSSPSLGLRGVRNTETRLKEYGLNDFIHVNSSILDIGSNIGFLDMEIARFAGNILGLEYSDILVEIANETVKALGINNLKFICTDYCIWQKNNTQKFDVIFSFAVHAWLNIRPDVYALQISNMLNDEGVFVFESQHLPIDALFDDFINSFKKEKLIVLKEGIVKDEEKADRKFLIMRKYENR